MTSSERTLKLMAYADGELDGADLEEVERWLAEDPDGMRMANDFAELGSFVKTGFAASDDAKAAASFDVADAIMTKIDAGSAAPVVSLDAARAKKSTQAQVAQKAGVGSTSYRAAGGIVAAMALAAAVFMFARPKDEEPLSAAPVHAPVAVVEAPAASSSGGGSESTQATQAGGGVGVEINIAETAERSASVVYLPGDNSLTTSVVLWVDETGDKK